MNQLSQLKIKQLSFLTFRTQHNFFSIVGPASFDKHGVLDRSDDKRGAIAQPPSANGSFCSEPEAIDMAFATKSLDQYVARDPPLCLLRRGTGRDINEASRFEHRTTSSPQGRLYVHTGIFCLERRLCVAYRWRTARADGAVFLQARLHIIPEYYICANSCASAAMLGVDRVRNDALGQNSSIRSSATTT